jgi:hypothetical protein
MSVFSTAMGLFAIAVPTVIQTAKQIKTPAIRMFFSPRSDRAPDNSYIPVTLRTSSHICVGKKTPKQRSGVENFTSPAFPGFIVKRCRHSEQDYIERT